MTELPAPPSAPKRDWGDPGQWPLWLRTAGGVVLFGAAIALSRTSSFDHMTARQPWLFWAYLFTVGIFVLLMARELVLLLLGCALLYWIGQQITGMSSVGAILVGACIIAWAILASRRTG